MTRVLMMNWRDLAHPAAGGAEVYTEAVLARWAAQGHEVTLFSAAVEGRPAEEVVDGYRVVRRGGRYTVYREARRWYQREGRGRFDVVIDQTNTVPFLAHEYVDDAAVIGFFHQTCEEIWHHNMPAGVAHLGRYALEPRWIRRYRDRPVLTVSESTAASLARFGVNDTIVLPEGFEPPPVLPAVTKEQTPTAVYCARMIDYKRPQDVVAAVTEARRRVPGLQVWMIGGGPMLDDLRADAPEGVHFLGRVSDEEKLDRMARAHVHLAASVREGWGLVVSEAAALGTPTLAYDVPGLRDSTLAADGALCPPHPDAMARWLGDLMPRYLAEPYAPRPYGGATSWDDVATAMYQAVMAKARTATPRRRWRAAA